MITEDYCSYEVAKLLKEKGFDEPCRTYYQDEEFVDDVCTQYYQWNSKSPFGHISAPTHQMAMAWLREEKNIIVNVWYNGVDYATEYFEPNTQMGVGKFVFIGDGYYAYEDAVEAALKYCLKNLI